MIPRTAALIPATQQPAQAQSFGPIPQIGESSALGHATRSLREAGVDTILAVAGDMAHEVLAEAARMRIGCVVDRGPGQDMLSRVSLGLTALPPDLDAVLVLPMDVPLVRPRTIRALLDRFGDVPLLFPSFLGRRGQPAMFRAGCATAVTGYQGDGGLPGALSALEALLGAEDLPVADANILFSLTSPEDYREALRRARRLGCPGEEETAALLAMSGMDPRTLDHCRAVARVAGVLAEAVGQARGWPPDLELVRSAALLHATARPGKDRAGRSARLLFEAGFPDTARIVEDMGDIDLPERAQLAEREIVSLADKLVEGGRIVGVRKRFQEKLARFAGDPRSAGAVAARRDRALALLARLEKECGASVRDILGRAGLYCPADGEEA